MCIRIVECFGECVSVVCVCICNPVLSYLAKYMYVMGGVDNKLPYMMMLQLFYGYSKSRRQNFLTEFST